MNRVAAITAMVWLMACRAALPPLPEVSTAAFVPAVRDVIQPALDAARARPEDAEAVGRLGMALHAHKQFDAARRSYLRASRIAPRDFRWHYYLGVVSEGQAAADALRAALKLQDNVTVRVKLGEALLALGDSNGAREVFRGVEHPAAWFGYGRAAGDPSYYEKAIAAFPQYGAALFALSQSYQRSGRAADAQRVLSQYEKYKLVAPPLDDPWMAAVFALNRGPEQLMSEAASLAAQGQLEAAVKLEQAALELDARLVRAHIELISLEARLGHAAEAEKHYRQALALDSKAEEAYYNYGVFCYGAGRRDDARAAFEKTLAINPNHAQAHNNLGSLLQEQGKLDAAAREFEKAIDLKPDLRLARFHLGRIYANRQRWGDAIEQLQRAAEGDEDGTPTYLYALGATQARAGMRDAAVASLGSAMEKAAARGQSALAASIRGDLAKLQR